MKVEYNWHIKLQSSLLNPWLFGSSKCQQMQNKTEISLPGSGGGGGPCVALEEFFFTFKIHGWFVLRKLDKDPYILAPSIFEWGRATPWRFDLFVYVKWVSLCLFVDKTFCREAG